jgi:hypothetical protein
MVSKFNTTSDTLLFYLDGRTYGTILLIGLFFSSSQKRMNFLIYVMKENTSKIVELIDKVIIGLNNGDLIPGKYGVSIAGYSINSEDTSLKGELCLTISDNKRSEPVMLMSYEYPELKDKMINLRDAIKASHMKKLNDTLVNPFIQALDRMYNQRNRIS